MLAFADSLVVPLPGDAEDSSSEDSSVQDGNTIGGGASVFMRLGSPDSVVNDKPYAGLQGSERPVRSDDELSLSGVKSWGVKKSCGSPKDETWNSGTSLLKPSRVRTSNARW